MAESYLERAVDSVARWLVDVRQLDRIVDWDMRVLGPALSQLVAIAITYAL